MKIYVGNLSYKLSEDELRDMFDEFGEVISSKIIVDKESGRSKGFGFITMASADDAKGAIKDLDGMEVKGRPIKVSEAKPRRGGRPKSNEGFQNKDRSKKRIFI